MKKSVFIVAMVAVGLLIGCADNNSINGPVATGVGSAKMALVKPNSTSATIPLDAVLSFGGNDLEVPQTYQVKGEIQYSLGISAHNNILPLEIYSMSTNVDATVIPLNTDAVYGTIKVKSSEALEITEAEVAKCEEVFPIEGWPFSLELHVQLLVTRDEVTLGSMWLARTSPFKDEVAESK